MSDAPPPGWDSNPTPDEIEGWIRNGTYVEFSRWSICNIDGRVSVAFALRRPDGRITYTLMPPQDFLDIAERVKRQLERRRA